MINFYMSMKFVYLSRSGVMMEKCHSLSSSIHPYILFIQKESLSTPLSISTY